MIIEKVALVTGSSQGIGKAIATRLARQGYAVAVNSRQPEGEVRETLREIDAWGKPRLYVQGDVAMAADRHAMVERVVQEFGRIDLLVNNAGVGPAIRRDILETTEESMHDVLAVNICGTFFLSQEVAKFMIEERQRHTELTPLIINISSISAYTSSTSRGEYCISKAGVSMITKLYADRLAGEGIRVYEIRPGIIETEMTCKVHDKYSEMIGAGMTPIKRWGQPEDVAQAVIVLCSGELSFSTGDVLNVDGGYHIRRL